MLTYIRNPLWYIHNINHKSRDRCHSDKINAAILFTSYPCIENKSTMSFHSNSWHMSIIKQKTSYIPLKDMTLYILRVGNEQKIQTNHLVVAVSIIPCTMLFKVIYKHSLGPTCHPSNKLMYSVRLGSGAIMNHGPNLTLTFKISINLSYVHKWSLVWCVLHKYFK